MPGQASEKTLSDIETLVTAGNVDLAAIETLITTTNSLVTTMDAVIDAIKTNTDDIETLIEGMLGLTARTYAAPVGATLAANTDTQVMAANANRKFAVIDIESPTDDVYVGIGSAAVVAKGLRIKNTSGTQRILIGTTPTSLHGAGDVQVIQLPLTTQEIRLIDEGTGTSKYSAIEAD